MNWKSLLTELTCFLLILLLGYTAISKWLEFEKFYRQMYNQEWGHTLSVVLITTLPAVELIIAVLLVFDKCRVIGLTAALTLLFLFTIYIILVLLHAFARVPCSCGGFIEHLTWTQHLLLNMFFLLTGSWSLVLLRRKSKHSLDHL